MKLGVDQVLKDALEANIKQAIEPNPLVMTFMVNHAATIINRFAVDLGARHRWRRRTEKPQAEKLLSSGEKSCSSS